jgi:predicted glutamine amidotransferase
MLAIMSTKKIPSSFLQDFKLLTEKGKILPNARPGHKDGWGIVCYQDRTPTYLGRQPSNAIEDPKYNEACQHLDESHVAGVLLAHLRKVSPEYKDVSLENTAPFVQNEWCFAHNGTINKFNPPINGLKGATDSERFFRLLLKEMENHSSIEETIEETVRGVRSSFHYTSMTFLLSNGISIYAYRDYSDPRNCEYYNLMYAQDKNMVILSQEPIWFRDWVQIPQRNLITVNRDLKVCSQQIG